jgi:hypothetical protein
MAGALVVGEAAVDVEGLAGDEVAVGGQQEGDGADQVGGDLDPAQGGGGGHGLTLVRGDGLAFDLGGGRAGVTALTVMRLSAEPASLFASNEFSRTTGYISLQVVRISSDETLEARHIRRHVPAADVPVLRFGKGPGLTQQERLALIRRFATSGDLPLHLRVAACLMLLYAQPLARVVRLAAGDIIRDDGQVYLRFGTPPAPVPDPFAAMLVELAAAGAGTGWLFPGRNAGQPRDYRSVYHALRDAGLPMRNARTSALRHLVIQAPAPVVADALGFHQTTTTRQFTSAGGTWSRYAASRRPSGPPDRSAAQPAPPRRTRGA